MEVQNLKITKILPEENGQTKAGKKWSKLTFVGETDQDYNNLYAFEIFQGEGKDNLDKFKKFNKEGDVVSVSFNVQCREYQGKYYTTLSAWSIKGAGASSNEGADVPSGGDDDTLPF
jgi:hypothetical protein